LIHHSKYTASCHLPGDIHSVLLHFNGSKNKNLDQNNAHNAPCRAFIFFVKQATSYAVNKRKKKKLSSSAKMNFNL
jgi:hypothetical protein